MTRDTGWLKSTHSDAGNDQCVEVRLTPNTVSVRDSKSPAAQFRLAPTAWASLLALITQE